MIDQDKLLEWLENRIAFSRDWVRHTFLEVKAALNDFKVEPQVWIPIHDRKPEIGTECMTHDATGKINLLRYGGQSWLWSNVTHWMPRPESPAASSPEQPWISVYDRLPTDDRPVDVREDPARQWPGVSQDQGSARYVPGYGWQPTNEDWIPDIRYWRTKA